MMGTGTGAIAPAAAMLALLAATPCLAEAEAGAETMQALPGPAYEAARAAFEALPEADRISIQDALVWTGDYASTADGDFGRRTFEAILAWQQRAKRPASGILDRPSLAALAGAAGRAKAAAGFAVVTDPASGVRIGIPQKLLPKRSPNTIGGTRYQSADERVTLDTRSQPGGPDELRGLYERNIAIRTAGRNVTYRLARPDFFVIAGETAGGRFYSLYAQGEGAIRGFSIGYDKALAGDLDRISVAVANSFQPFGKAAPEPGLMAERPVPPPRPAATAAGLALTGLAVAPRRVLAPAAALETCPEPRIDGAAARIVSKSRDFAVIEPASPRRPAPLRFAAGPPEGSGLVAFFAGSEGGRAVVTPAEFVAEGRLVAPLQDGATGAVVLDRTGAVAGMVGSVTLGRRTVAGLVPPATYAFIGAAPMKDAAGAQQGPADGPAAAGSASAILPALVRIECSAQARQPAEPPRIRLPAGNP